MDITGSSDGNRYGALQNFKLRPGLAFGIIILIALLAFEIFNYSTTDYALRDLLGELRFAGIHWATILSIAFCGIDFAGIARLFTPEQSAEEPKEVWYLLGAWLLAATMNATLTWWGVSMAITNHTVVSGQTVVDPNTLTHIVPVFVAIMVWVIRILIIGSLSYAGERIFTTDDRRLRASNSSRRPSTSAGAPRSGYAPASSVSMAPRPSAARAAANARPAARQPVIPTSESPLSRPEPTYHSLNARPASVHPPMGDQSRGHS